MKAAAPSRLRFPSGLYVRAPGNQTSGALGLNVMTACPLQVPAPAVFDRITCMVAGLATALVRLGIYNDNGSGYPGALLLDAGTVDAAVGGIKEININQVVPAGIIWMVGVSQVADVPVNYLANSGLPLPFFYNASANITALNHSMGFSQAGVNGALPATFSTVWTQTNTVMAIAGRVV